MKIIVFEGWESVKAMLECLFSGFQSLIVNLSLEQRTFEEQSHFQRFRVSRDDTGVISRDFPFQEMTPVSSPETLMSTPEKFCF